MDISRRAFLGGTLAVLFETAVAEAGKPGEPVDNGRMGYFVLDPKTGVPFQGLSQNADNPELIASTTKVMPAVVTFDAMVNGQITPDDRLTVSRRAGDQGGSAFDMRAGQSFTVDELLRRMMGASCNRSSMVLAEGVGKAMGGGYDTFLDRMNAKAREWGLTSTNFKDPNGLHDKNKSTAREMAIMMGKIVTGYPLGCQVYFGLKNHRGKKNHFESLGWGGIDAVKSGWTTAAGRCCVFSAEREGKRVAGAILHAPTSTHGSPNALREAQARWLVNEAFIQMGVAPVATTASDTRIWTPREMRYG